MPMQSNLAEEPVEPLAVKLHQLLAAQFYRRRDFSFLLLIHASGTPTFKPGDLGSHVYNAWLAQLASMVRLPRLCRPAQWNNICSDVALEQSARLFGWHAAEILTVSAAS